VLELQLAACLAIHELTAGSPGGAAPAPSAEEFERRLARREIDLTGTDPALADALAAAGSLRQAIPGYVVAPTHEFVQRLRTELVTGRPAAAPGAAAVAGARAPTLSERLEAAGSDPFPALELPEAASSAATPTAGGPVGGSRGGKGVLGWLARRPWLATGVATAGIVLVLGLQAFGAQDKPRECGGRPCPASTTAAVAAGEGDGSRIRTPLTTVVEPTTSSTVNAGPAAAPTAAPPASAVTAPPTTRPATTAAPTTSASRPTTTTRATTTTAPTTTLPTTTTTAAPPP